MAQEDDEERKKAAEARAADTDGEPDARSEAADNGKKKGWVPPPGDHSVFKPGEAGDPGDKGVEGHLSMPYDYR